jgi:glyoxylate/hydroxypyruvate reductase
MAILFFSTTDRDAIWRAEMEKHLPDMPFRVWPGEVVEPGEIDYALVWKPQAGVLKGFPNLKVILSLGAGVDHLLSDPELPEGVPIVRLVDPLLTSGMTEFVTWAVLHCHRDMLEFSAFQKESRWQELRAPDIETRRVGIMGLGVLGSDSARRLRDFGFPVAGWDLAEVSVDGIETFTGKDGFVPFLERTDILVSLLPLTPETRDIINGETLAALPRGAYVVNSARGLHVVDGDLIEALDSGHIAGAVLDVFREEPLDSGHPFWRHPRVVVTPHVASLTIARTAAEYYANAIKRHQQGLPLENLVDMSRGY